MFAKSIVLTDAFLDMPMSARCLYFTLGMLADDDGFVGSPKSIMRQCGASQDDLAVLLSKRFVLGFDSGVIVIKHWRINNYLQNDRHKPTTYQEELASLMIDQKGSYTERDKKLPEQCIQMLSTPYTECIQDVYQMDTDGIQSVSTDKNSIDKNSIDKKREEKTRRFTPPSLEEVKEYCQERQNSVNPQAFIDFYKSKGWKIGKETMQDWKAAIRTWESRESTQPKRQKKYTTAAEYVPPKPKSTEAVWKVVDQI